MNILKSNFVRAFIRMCDDGFSQGWHERNGGNLSYRIKHEEIDDIKEDLSYDEEFIDIGVTVESLANEYFLITGSGKYFRNIILSPKENIGIIQINDSGRKYRKVWGLENEAKPTSELATHLMNHQVKKIDTNDLHRVIYHCHTTNIIALTFILPLEGKVFTRQLWEMATECPVVFPEGVGVIKWMVPGSREIAIETSKIMKKYNIVVWAHHGIFCSGEDFDLTFGLAHTVEKSAEILVKVLSIRSNKLQTITTEDFILLAKDFNVDLNRECLEI